ncbi:MAG: acyltransferase [Burkholderiales bacterium]|nr:acyltransferase [Bacteroidia bacterium]
MRGRIYLKGINGLRAISAISVVVSHINLSLVQFNLNNLGSIDLAGYGVTIFFAISGFLITFLMLKEKEKANISITKFYIRRVLRIWPLYFLVLILSIVTAHIYHLGNLPGSLPFYILLAANIPFIFENALPFLGHYWSLGVEEQFYLFWPWIFRNRKNPLKFVVIFTITFFFLRLLFRLIEYKFGYSLPYTIIHVTRFDCMAIGGIGGILWHEKNFVFRKISKHIITQLISWTVIFLLMFNQYGIASVIDQEIVAIITVFLIINLSFNHKTIISLDYPIFDFLGKISYGMYVIHQLVIFYFARALNELTIDTIFKYPVIFIGVIGLTILFAYMSYEFFEKWFLKIKERFSVVKTASTEKDKHE